MSSTVTRGVGLAEAKNQLSALTNEANATGQPFIIYKNHQPWAEVRPLSVHTTAAGSITITPVRHEVKVPKLDTLFCEYDGRFVPREDGFAGSAGAEEF